MNGRLTDHSLWSSVGTYCRESREKGQERQSGATEDRPTDLVTGDEGWGELGSPETIECTVCAAEM